MSHSIHPDDPVLTAYVLGELSDEERAAVDAALTADSDLHRAVEELQAVSAGLFEALQAEPVPELSEQQRAAIRAAATSAGSQLAKHGRPRSEEGTRKRTAVAVYVAIGTVAVAVVAAVVVPVGPPQSGQTVASNLWGDALDVKLDFFGLHTNSNEDYYDRVESDLPLPAVSNRFGERGVIAMFDAGSPSSGGDGLGSVDNTPVDAPLTELSAAPLEKSSSLRRSLAEQSERHRGASESSRPASSAAIVQNSGRPPASASGPVPSQASARWYSKEALTQSSAPADGNSNGEFASQSGRFLAATEGKNLSLQTMGQPAPIRLSTVTDLDGDGIAAGSIPQPSETLIDLPFRPGSVQLGVPQLEQNIASNASSPESDLLYESLRGSRSQEMRGLLRRDPGPGSEAYAPIVENPFVSPRKEPLSTFGLDVDTASYANVRRFLRDEQRWPPADAVRLEEMINYFAYDDPEPAEEHPLAVTLETAACPWAPAHRLVRVGVKGREIDHANRPPTSLVFLIDTSGSMRSENKLPLVKQSLRLLVSEMTEDDRIALVTYSTNAGLLLDSTPGERRELIMTMIDSLQANGSTNGEAGLKVAYEVASQHFIEDGTNRVILCTDGDFNVGESSDAPLVRMISEKRDTGVFLSICGFGTGNLKDAKLEQIADNGNGHYHYIDSIHQARKTFLEDLSGMLYTIAKDVKLQVEFNPAKVGAYRLLGYENRALAAQDFNDDRVDAGDVGAGHSVTALYEIVPAGADVPQPTAEVPGVDPLKYQTPNAEAQQPADVDRPAAIHQEPSSELLTVKLRYKQPTSSQSVKLEFPLEEHADIASSSDDLSWAAAVASFGMILRNSSYRGQSSIEGVLELARGAMGEDPRGDRREFIELVLEARSIYRRTTGTSSPAPRELTSIEAREKATIGGRYRELLDKFPRPDDFDLYGEFHDAGRKPASPDGKHPGGFWVYVYPHWYVWGETTAVSEAAPESSR